jgi:dTDP-glucose pyrophosphorylase
VIRYLLITAAGTVQDSSQEERLDTLRRAVDYYRPLGFEVVVALNESQFGRLAGAELLSESSHISIAHVPEKVQGALATANFAMAALGVNNGSLHIAAGDTFFHDDSALNAISNLSSSAADAGTVVFESSDERHSFVTLDELGNAQFVAEKTRLSQLATSGNFYFAKTEEFLEASKWCFTNNTNLNGKFFVSTALNFYVYQGRKVSVERINSTIVCKLWADSGPGLGGAD